MKSGAELFFRYARPPNLRGYCGPDDPETVSALASGVVLPAKHVDTVAGAFSGAWPYLATIGAMSGVGPLDRTVVQAYWLGAPLDHTDVTAWGHSAQERFGLRAGRRWERISEAIDRGGRPSHDFHVFCVYPWVGLLRAGNVDPSLAVLDQCRVSWASVVAVEEESAVVSRRPLVWENNRLSLSGPTIETCAVPPGITILVGEWVAIHWSSVCQVLSIDEATHLVTSQRHHLRLANSELTTGRLELEP